MKTIACLLLCLTAATLPAQGLYKWVDAQGKISYSDQPPPPSMQVKDLSGMVNILGAGQAQAENLPFELAQLVTKSPVVIYTSKGCGSCDQGRSLLRSKNVPFTEKTIASNADLKALDAQFNAQTLPVLAVGAKSINGFGASQWGDALAEAGYSDAYAIPKTFVNGTASPMTGSTSPAASKPDATKPGANEAAAPARRRAAATASTPAVEPVVKFQK